MSRFNLRPISVLLLAFFLLAPTICPAEETSPPLSLLNPAPHSSLGGKTPAVAGPSSGQLEDIYPPVAIHDASRTLLWLGGGLVCLLLAAGIAYGFMRVKAKRNVPPPISPWDKALSAIAAARHIREAGQFYRYAEAMSVILRQYLEERFGIVTTRRTTKELNAAMDRAGNEPILREAQPQVIDVLQRLDMTKFAKFTPQPEELMELEASVTELIGATRPTPAASGEKP